MRRTRLLACVRTSVPRGILSVGWGWVSQGPPGHSGRLELSLGVQRGLQGPRLLLDPQQPGVGAAGKPPLTVSAGRQASLCGQRLGGQRVSASLPRVSAAPPPEPPRSGSKAQPWFLVACSPRGGGAGEGRAASVPRPRTQRQMKGCGDLSVGVGSAHHAQGRDVCGPGWASVSPGDREPPLGREASDLHSERGGKAR